MPAINLLPTTASDNCFCKQQGDRGWEVFSLVYHLQSPLSTIFTPQAMEAYLRLFNFLWRLKRWGGRRKKKTKDRPSFSDAIFMLNMMIILPRQARDKNKT
jgi:hypothetical protein